MLAQCSHFITVAMFMGTLKKVLHEKSDSGEQKQRFEKIDAYK